MQKPLDPMSVERVEMPSASYVLRRRYGPSRHIIAAASWITVISMLLQPVAMAGTIYWDGGGADNNWSTLANWSTSGSSGTPNPSSLPGSSDDVVFYSRTSRIGTGVVNQNFTLQSLTLGNDNFKRTTDVTIGAGSSTLTLNGKADYDYAEILGLDAMEYAIPGNLGTVGLYTRGYFATTINEPMALGGSQQWIIEGSANKLTVTGTLNLGSYTLTVGGSGSSTISGAIGGTGNLVKEGNRILILSGNINTYSGSTTIKDGTLKLDYTTNNNNKLSDTGVLYLAGGTLTLNSHGTINYTEEVASTTCNEGTSSSVNQSNSSTGRAKLAMKVITRNIGATVTFGAASIATTTTGNQSGLSILGGYATVQKSVTSDGYEWARNDGSGNIVGSATYVNDTWTAGNNTSVTVNSSPASGATTGSLYFDTFGDFTVTLSGANTITSGGILANMRTGWMIPGPVPFWTIAGGTLTSGNGQDLIVHMYGGSAFGGALQISSQITGGIGLTKTGASTSVLVLDADNNYTGKTYVNTGRLQVGAGGTTGSVGSGEVVLGRGGEIVFNRSDNWTVANNITGTLTSGSSGSSGSSMLMAGTGTMTLSGANSIPGVMIYAGTVNVTGSMQTYQPGLYGAGTLKLSGANGRLTAWPDFGGLYAWSSTPGVLMNGNNSAVILDNSVNNNTDRFPDTMSVSAAMGSPMFRFIGNSSADSAETILNYSLYGSSATISIEPGGAKNAVFTINNYVGSSVAPSVGVFKAGTGALGGQAQIIVTTDGTGLCDFGTGNGGLAAHLFDMHLVSDTSGLNFASWDSVSGQVTAFTGYYTGFTGGSDQVVGLSGGGIKTLGANNTVAAMKIAGGTDLSLGSYTLAVTQPKGYGNASGLILKSGTGTTTISGGKITPFEGASPTTINLGFYVEDGTLAIGSSSSGIALRKAATDASAMYVTKAGPGVLDLTYTTLDYSQVPGYPTHTKPIVFVAASGVTRLNPNLINEITTDKGSLKIAGGQVELTGDLVIPVPSSPYTRTGFYTFPQNFFGMVQWQTGGFAASGGTRTVSFAMPPDVGFEPRWGYDGFLYEGPMILSSPTATGKIVIATPIDLGQYSGGSLGPSAPREIQVLDNPDSAADMAEISAQITGAYNRLGIVKTGSGTLILSNGNNTYIGATTVREGKLVVNGTLASPGGTVTVNSGATLGGTATIQRNVNFEAGSAFAVEMNDTFNDPLDVAGDLVANATVTVYPRIMAGSASVPSPATIISWTGTGPADASAFALDMSQSGDPAQTVNWDGGGGNNLWSTSENWDLNCLAGGSLAVVGKELQLSGVSLVAILPMATSVVVIGPTGSSPEVTAPVSSTTVGSLTVGRTEGTDTARLDVNNGGDMTVTGATVVNAKGTLAIGSGRTLTTVSLNLQGQLRVVSASTVTSVGRITVGPASGSGSGEIYVDTAHTWTYGETIADNASGTGGLTKTGAGTLILSGANTYTGETIVQAGTLNVNGTLDNSGGLVTVMTSTTLGGTGTINRPVVLTDSSVIGSTGTLTLGSSLTLNSGTAILTGGTVSVGGSATVNGTLNGTSGTLAISSDGTLKGTGTVNRPVTINNGATLHPGVNIGTLTVGADITNEAGSIFAWEAKGYTTETGVGTAGTDYSRVAMTSGKFTLAAGTKLGVYFPAGENFGGTFWDSNRTWDIITGGSVSSTGSIADGDIKVYVNNTEYDGGDRTITGQGAFSTTRDGGILRLTWTATGGTQYTVTFNANNGSGTMAPQTASVPTALTANTFTRTGYTFAGWGTVSGGPVVYANGATYSFTADVTLYAQWTVASAPSGTVIMFR